MAGPLAGTLVLDLSRALAGPHAAMMLGDMGARVIKVESPGGDDSRRWGPPFVSGESTYFFSCNRNKESVVLDLKSAEGRETLERLVGRADVLIENFRPGVLDRLGFPVTRLHELNPGLVVLSITGFGHDGPEGGRAGYDQIAQGEAGLMSLTGLSEPTRTGVPIGDLLAGVYGAYGVASALAARERTGQGVVVRTSLLAALVGVHAFQGTRHTVAGQNPGLTGNHHPSIAPYGAFGCADGMIQVACGTEEHWRRFAKLLDIDPEEFPGNADRIARHRALVERLESVLRTRPRRHWLDLLAAEGVPAGAIRTIEEVYTWEQTLSQGLVIEVDHPATGRVRLPGSPLRVERADGTSVTRTRHLPPPLLGEHDETIRRELDEGLLA
ncbi:CaiB/BaiF CoA transferase family protein [Nonomuraea africana]|uniref:CaiB/BaiF CoA transferase family protein n=1 Tax=Nonomuraea africana TaxID=46171 RepID=UPI0033F4B8EE